MFCSHCGHELPDDAEKCENCGTPFDLDGILIDEPDSPSPAASPPVVDSEDTETSDKNDADTENELQLVEDSISSGWDEPGPEAESGMEPCPENLHDRKEQNQPAIVPGPGKNTKHTSSGIKGAFPKIRISPKVLICIVLVCAAFAIVFNMLGDGAKSEREILSDLCEGGYYVSDVADVSDFEITKRQTDRDNHSDIIYITVQTDERDIQCKLSYVMRYELYNDGWLLESVERDYDGDWELNGITDEQILNDIAENDPFVVEYNSETSGFETEAITIETDWTNGSMNPYGKTVTVSYTASSWRIDYMAAYDISYVIEDGAWVYQYLSTLSSNCTPNYIPSVDASNKIMDELEYDSYEYLRTDEDFENSRATVIYSATKIYDLGSEEYLVEIPVTFELSYGDRSDWSYSSSTIMHNIQTVDWSNIIGSYAAEGDGVTGAFYSSHRVNLTISDITETCSDGTFTATIMCDAEHSAGLGGSDYCSTGGQYISANVTQKEPGVYRLSVEDQEYYPSWITDWEGNFTIQLFNGDDWSGVRWDIYLGEIVLQKQ